MPTVGQNTVAYREGVFARALGRSCHCNPYPEDSADAARWTHGWWLIGEPATASWLDDAPRHRAGDETNGPIRTALANMVDIARTLATGLLLAASGFTLSFAVLRFLAP